ncbi:MAG: DUF2156 domain-containing protein [Anaerolineae bacterium]|nr:DUF2156 domain-containing protein [Anaerolineae bacterium]
MTAYPVFPEFKSVVLEDRDEIQSRLRAYQPETSELSFGNFFIWHEHYQFQWSVLNGCMVILASAADTVFALPPVGPPPRSETARELLQWMRDERGIVDPVIARADRRLVAELEPSSVFEMTPTREHFDYVYRSEDLGNLTGRRYSKKRNHINNFSRQYTYEYAPLTEALVPDTLTLAEVWCEQRACEEDISLAHEFVGIKESLEHFSKLGIEGGVILIDGRVQAFALGEMLNERMAVVHIEKGNPEFAGIYPMITKLFSLNRWQDIAYINREQDLGDPGLRQAKESYYPDHMVEKFEVRLRGR